MDMNTFKTIRGYLGLTQQELAEEVGVTYNTIRNIESGRTKISLLVAGRLCNIVDVNTEEFKAYQKRFNSLYEG